MLLRLARELINDDAADRFGSLRPLLRAHLNQLFDPLSEPLAERFLAGGEAVHNSKRLDQALVGLSASLKAGVLVDETDAAEMGGLDNVDAVLRIGRNKRGLAVVCHG